MKKRHEQKLVLVSIIIFILLNVPIILLFDKADKVIGIPMIYAYIFMVWIASIAITFFVVKRYNE
ncbi:MULTISPECIES: hypothetical protein [Edaphocola]|jgi:hypothetical protein|uniref:hypothetical protein n=1 Tax=Edaphocola TaxID=2601681 RepID=UPI00100AD4EE|nr:MULTISPECIES: hypothetical protein [Edaphocola]